MPARLIATNRLRIELLPGCWGLDTSRHDTLLFCVRDHMHQCSTITLEGVDIRYRPAQCVRNPIVSHHIEPDEELQTVLDALLMSCQLGAPSIELYMQACNLVTNVTTDDERD